MIAALLFQKMINKRRFTSEKRVKVAEKSDENTSTGVCCRTCLGTDNLVPIFSGSDDAKMSNNLQLVTGLEIKKNDGLSQKICKKCLGIFNRALQFRHRSKRAEKTLLGMVNVVPKKFTVTVDIEPKMAKAKLEKEDYGYDDMAFTDDFQNDTDFEATGDVKPVYVKTEQKTAAAKPRGRRGKLSQLPSGPPYKCNWCSKEFRMKATYTAHLRFHTNYCVCESCGKRCRNNNQLQEHKRARHGLGRIHKCAYCDYSSATKEALTIHERRHTGERPYICDHCGATFHRRANLVQHIAIHLPEKKFQCSFCPIREKSKKRLQIHISKTHRVQRYSHKCPRCFKLFQRKEHAHRHLSRVHHVPRADHPPVERVPIDNSHRSDGYTHVDCGPGDEGVMLM